MDKRFRFKLSLISLRCCRSNQVSSVPKSTTNSTLFSPINPKVLQISYYDNTIFPEPPPTTPAHCSAEIMPFSIKGPESKCKMKQKMYNNPVAYDLDDNALPLTPPEGHENSLKIARRKGKLIRGTMMSVSSADSGWFSSGEYDDESSTESFDSSCEYGNAVIVSRRKKNNGNVKVRKLLGFGRKMMISCGEGKVRESFAVVKKSEDPYEDFKRSMTEMITKKEMFEAKDLEQLLQCFLTLNARHHHVVIVQVFSDIWNTLFL